MQIDGDENLPVEEGGADSETPSSAPSRAPPPLYTAYYTKSETIPADQISLYENSEFGSEIPEEPPPFELCYKPGETPKRFEPKSNK